MEGCLFILFCIAIVFAGLYIEVFEPLGFTEEQMLLFCGSTTLALGFAVYLNPKLTAQIVLSPIWLPPYLAASLTLETARSRSVREWAIENDMLQPVVWAWWYVVPVLLSIGWFAINLCWFNSILSFSIELACLLGILSTALAFYFYEDQYINSHPNDAPAWSIFIAAGQDMQFTQRMMWIEEMLKLKIWWHNLGKD